MTQSDELERIRLQLLQDGYDEDAVSDTLLKLVERGEVPSMSFARRIAWNRVMDEKRRQRIIKRGAPLKLNTEGRQLERASARQELERLGPVAINPHLPEEDPNMAYDRARDPDDFYNRQREDPWQDEGGEG